VLLRSLTRHQRSRQLLRTMGKAAPPDMVQRTPPGPGPLCGAAGEGPHWPIWWPSGNRRQSQDFNPDSGAGGARTHDPGIMRPSEVPLTRTYAPTNVRTVHRGSVPCRILAISAHTPCVSGGRRPWAPGYPRTLEVESGNGKWWVGRSAPTPAGQPRRGSSWSRRWDAITQGFRPQIAADARAIPAFELDDKGRCYCTRFRISISMQYPWVKKYGGGVPGREAGVWPSWATCELLLQGQPKI
jgi:hypothetical protein